MDKRLENYINDIPKDECEAYGHWFFEDKCIKCKIGIYGDI